MQSIAAGSPGLWVCEPKKHRPGSMIDPGLCCSSDSSFRPYATNESAARMGLPEQAQPFIYSSLRSHSGNRLDCRRLHSKRRKRPSLT